MPTQYNPTLVVVSVLIAILASYTALDFASSVFVSSGRTRRICVIAGSVAMGTGIWSMHFTGMLAFHLPGHTIAYQTTLLVASIVVAVLASALALFTITLPRIKPAHFGLAGLLMGAAIAGMHYTGMASVRTGAVISWNGWLVVASISIAVAASFVALLLALRVGATQRQRRFKIGGAVVMGLAISGMHYTAMAAAHFIHEEQPHVIGQNVLATSSLAVAVIATSLLILLTAIAGSVIVRDVMQRTELAALVRASEEWHRALIETASELIVVVDAQGLRKYVSPSYVRSLGYQPEQLIGRSAFDYVHPDDLPRARAAFLDLAARPDGVGALDLRLRNSTGGYRAFHIVGQNLLDNPAVQGIVMAAEDETERRHLESQVQQAQKMEAVGVLAGGVAQDFNNLLTVILGHVDLLQSESYSPQELQTGLREIQDSALRAATLTRQLLAFSRQQMLQPRRINLNVVVKGMKSTCKRVMTGNITIHSHLSPDLWLVNADPGQIEQALLNLAVNARDAMPDGGTLHFESRNINVAEGSRLAGHDTIPAGDYACLAVRDTGVGMERHTMDRIFEPFFTTKDLGRSSGLGLASVYGIMRQSGGYVSVRSTPEHGTTFELFFPRATKPSDSRGDDTRLATQKA